jgi:ABC-type antimicrobial peptide transport system permease subunit
MAYWNTTCYPLAEALRNDFGDFAHVTQAAGPMKRYFAVDRGNGEVVRFEERYVLYVDTAYASVFDLTWLAGNPKKALTLRNSIVLTEQVAEKAFGKIANGNYASVLGKTLMLNSQDPMTVTGIVKDAPGNTTLRYKILVPYIFYKENNPYYAGNWAGNYQGTTFVVLRDNSQEEAIEQKIASWKKKYLKPEDDARIDYFLQPITRIHNETLYGSAPGSYTMSTRIIRAAGLVGIFILVIAAVNFVNLTTARAVTRSKEVGIRKVMGGNRVGVMLQFLSEHSLLIVVTLLISVGLSQLAVDQLNDYLTAINLRLTFTWNDAGIIVLTGCSVILLAAVYPAVVMSSFKPVEAIRNKIGLARPGNFSLRRMLIMFQFTVVQLLIIATIVVATQINHLNSAELGFATESIISIPTPDYERIDEFRNRLMEVKDITDVAYGSTAPIEVDGGYGTSYRASEEDVVAGRSAQMKGIDPSYLSFYDIRLVAGRNIGKPSEPFDEFVVNEKLAKSMGWTPEQAIGRKLVINEGPGTIVGVVENYQNESWRAELQPVVLLNWKWMDRAYVRVSKQTPATLQAIEKAWKEFKPEGVFSHMFVADGIDGQYALERMVFHGFSLFSALAIMIGCLGLFGLSSFMAIRRAKEIGIRKVLGASLAHIMSQFSKEFVWLVIGGFVVAAPLAWFIMDRWLQEFAYRIALGWWMFAAGGFLALLIAVITVSFHSIKAGLANPVDTIKNE